MVGINFTSLETKAKFLTTMLIHKGFSSYNARSKGDLIMPSLNIDLKNKILKHSEYNPEYYSWTRSDVEPISLLEDEVLLNYINPKGLKCVDLSEEYENILHRAYKEQFKDHPKY